LLRWICISLLVAGTAAAYADDIDDCNYHSNHARAIEACTTLIDAGKLNRRNLISAYKNRATANTEERFYDAAIADYTRAIDIDPRHPLVADSYTRRGTVYEKMRNYDRAIADFNKVIELTPKSSGAYGHCADAYAKKDDLDQAIAYYTRAIEVDPDAMSAAPRPMAGRIAMRWPWPITPKQLSGTPRAKVHGTAA